MICYYKLCINGMTRHCQLVYVVFYVRISFRMYSFIIGGFQEYVYGGTLVFMMIKEGFMKWCGLCPLVTCPFGPWMIVLAYACSVHRQFCKILVLFTVIEKFFFPSSQQFFVVVVA